jgi:hypothetical protein
MRESLQPMNSVSRPLAIVDELLELRAVLRERIVLEAPQPLEQFVGHGLGPPRLLHQRRAGGVELDALDPAAPASSCRYCRSAVAKACGAASAARRRTAS